MYILRHFFGFLMIFLYSSYTIGVKNELALINPGLGSSILAVHTPNYRKKPMIYRVSSEDIKGSKNRLKKGKKDRIYEKFSLFLDPYLSIPKITRLYITFSTFLSILNTIGLLKPEYLALHTKSIFLDLEFWRPLTSMAFFGQFTLSMITKLYIFTHYSKELEILFGSSQLLLLFSFQMILLSAICMTLQIPFFSSAFSAALLFICSKQKPDEIVNLILGIRIFYWQLPFASIFIDVINSQNVRAALPGLLGIFTGYAYHLLTHGMEEIGREPLIRAPKKLRKILDDDNPSDI